MRLLEKYSVGLKIGGIVIAGLAAAIWLGPSAPVASAVRPPAERTRPSRLQFPALAGEPWLLEQHRGKVVLLNFWATWCGPCRQETPALAKISREYAGKGLVVAGVALDEGGPAVVRDFVREFRVPYTMLLPGDSVLASNIRSLPTSILFDRQGRAAASYTGAISAALLERDLGKLLDER